VVRLRKEAARSDMALVSGLALLACVICAAAPAGLAALRVPLALPLVLVLPGYATVTALFAPDTLRAPERIMLSLSLSIVAAILTGLAVDIAGFKLLATPWVELLAAVTLLATATAFARGHESPLSLPGPLPRLRAHEWLALLAAVLLLAAAAAIGFRPLPPPAKTHGTVGFGLLEAPGGRGGVCISVINQEFHFRSYRVVVSVAGRATRTLTTTRLAPGATWNRELPVGADFPDVRAALYLGPAPSRAYRNTWLVKWAPYLRALHC